MEKYYDNIDTQVLTITPEQAQMMLTHNDGNIPPRENTINTFVDIINRGDWKLTTDAIGFSKTGRLLNGQHRLMACIEAQKPIICLVTKGLAEDAFMAIDTMNKRKSASDVLYLNNVPAYKRAAAILRGRARLANGSVLGSGGDIHNRVTPAMLFETYKSNSQLVDEIAKIASVCYRDGCKAIPEATYGIYMFYLILDKQKDKNLVYEFIETLADRRTSSRSNAMDILRKRMIDDRCSRARLTYKTIHYLIVNAWNAYQECRFIKCLKPNELDFI